MSSQNEITKLRSIVNRREQFSGVYHNSTFNTCYEISFYLWFRIHKSKSLKVGTAITLITYFYLCILTSIMSIPIEFHSQSSHYIKQSLILDNSTSEALILYTSKVDSIIIDLKNLLHLHFFIESHELSLIVLGLSILVFYSIIFIYKLRRKSKLNGLYSILGSLSYIIYFILTQPILDSIYRNSIDCSVNSSMRSDCRLTSATMQTNLPAVSIVFVLLYLILFLISTLFFGINRYNKMDCYNRLPTIYEFAMLNYLYIRTILQIVIYYRPELIYSIIIFNFIFFSALLFQF